MRRAISLNPKSPQAWNNLGIVQYDRRDFKQAVECYEQAISLNASYPEAHNNLGNALRALGKSNKALEHYQQALLIREGYAEAYNNMAAVLRGREQIAEAEHALSQGDRFKPKYLGSKPPPASSLMSSGCHGG